MTQKSTLGILFITRNIRNSRFHFIIVSHIETIITDDTNNKHVSSKPTTIGMNEKEVDRYANVQTAKCRQYTGKNI